MPIHLVVTYEMGHIRVFFVSQYDIFKRDTLYNTYNLTLRT